MKKSILTLIAFLIFSPSISLAAPLTQTQAESLINVVQASPATPASAFVNLITAFSNITIDQAESLIGVVQTAPGVPAKAFVNLLVSFTQDMQNLIPQTTNQGATTTISTTTPTTQPINVSACIENLSLSSNNGERAQSPGFSDSLIELYLYKITAVNTCNKDFFVDYQGYSWDGPNNALVAVPETGTIQGYQFRPWYQFRVENPVAGTYTATFTAHTADGTVVSLPLQITYTSHGLIPNGRSFDNLGVMNQ